MLTRVQAGTLSVVGLSVGGVYTSIRVGELDAVFDMGIAPRSFVGTRNVFLSHGHADHVGALASHIGLCGLARLEAPRVFLPSELAEDVGSAMEALGRGQRRPLAVPYAPMSPGDELLVGGDLWVRAYRTQHSVPSLAYLLFRRIRKLRPEFMDLPPDELRLRRERGDDLFRMEERGQVAYVTDTLVDVLDEHPALTEAKCLILECTFLDERKPKDEARSKCHVHLDEIIDRSASLHCEHLVLMHFSQVYAPREVRRVLTQRCPPSLLAKIQPLAPESGPWPG